MGLELPTPMKAPPGLWTVFTGTRSG